MAFGDLVTQNTTTSSTGNFTSPTISAAAAGSLLLLLASRIAAGGTFPTVDGFTRLFLTNTGNLAADWWFKYAAGGETNVTLTGESGTSGSWRMSLVNIEGPFDTSPLDVKAEDTSNISTVVTVQPSGNTASTTQADAFAAAFFAADSANNVRNDRAYNNSFTEYVFESATIATGRSSLHLAGRVLSSIGSYNCEFSTTGTGDEMYGSIAIFKKSVTTGVIFVPDNRIGNLRLPMRRISY